jgi:hypothetical protein
VVAPKGRTPPGRTEVTRPAKATIRQREIERYRKAAARLGAARIDRRYLNKIGKPQIAKALDRNRKQIRKGVQADG